MNTQVSPGNRVPGDRVGVEDGVVTAIDRACQDLLAGLSGDRERLTARVTESCQVIGPKGFLISKDEWIESHTSGVFEQRALNSVEKSTQVFGDTAVRCELQRSECVFHGMVITGLFRVLSVWHQDKRDWRLVAIQYTASEAASGEA